MSHKISEVVLPQLKRMRNADPEKPRQRCKRLVVEAGKSISMEDLSDERNQDGDSDTDTSRSTSSGACSSENLSSELPDEDTMPLVDEKKRVKYDDVKPNLWVKVVLKEPQNLERENNAVYYKDIYESDLEEQGQTPTASKEFNKHT
ncbi:Hypothetical predicted protein [Paramuricea clavata]|uniref:Uncharacterized protein n=1 Tax=Paramuricea clavata TaxID=317549 RepID=A0A7D9F1H8_PARCT|nr:Hypothetical predicted protein [Paramuricea clavata]CAB4020729.1 Hypothetical predicted protein [Paramuricea clavata]